MSGGTILRHITAAVASVLFVLAVILAVALLASPYALIPLIVFTPVGVVAAVLIWKLVFAQIPLLSKLVRFGVYVISCVLLAMLTLTGGEGIFLSMMVTTIVPPLILVVFGYFFRPPRVVAASESAPESRD